MNKRTNDSGAECAAKQIENIKAEICCEEAGKDYEVFSGVGLNAIWDADIDKWEQDRHVIDDCIVGIERCEQLKNKQDANRQKQSDLERLAFLAGIEKAAEKVAGKRIRHMADRRLKRVQK